MNLKYYKHTFIIHSVACILLLSSYNVYAGKEAAFEFLNYGLQTLIGPDLPPNFASSNIGDKIVNYGGKSWETFATVKNKLLLS